MGGAINYVYRGGQRLTAWMLYVILLLDMDLFRAFGVHVLVTSAIRTYEEQKRIFLERYVTAGNIRGRKVYDTRWWNGQLWYRISAAGTVAVPGTSNHEVQGAKAAVDIRDTGSNAGITSKNSARGRWIRDWCRRTGLLIASGDSFGEGWHFDVPGIFRTPPASPAGTEHTGTAGDQGEEFMAKIDDLWQQWLPGQAGVKPAGEAYLLFVETLTKVRDIAARIVKLNTGAETRDLVWGRPVTRDGKGVPAIQELADAKTLGMTANQKLDELLKRPPATLTDAQVEALAARVGEKVALSVAPGVLDLMSERLKS